MERERSYKNHAQVISVLTTQYGFTYDGLGDNFEECFFKDSETPEQIYVHRMFCSYYMSTSREQVAPRIHHAEFRSKYDSESEQRTASTQLLLHLDYVTVHDSVRVPEAAQVIPTLLVELKQPPQFSEIIRFNKILWPLFREKFTNGELPLEKALSALGLTHDQFRKMEAEAV